MLYTQIKQINSIKGTYGYNWLIDEKYLVALNSLEKKLEIYDIDTLQLADFMDFKKCDYFRKIGNSYYVEEKEDGIYHFSQVLLESKQFERCTYNGLKYYVSNPTIVDMCLGYFKIEGKKYVGIFNFISKLFLWSKPINRGVHYSLTKEAFIYQNKIDSDNFGLITALSSSTGEFLWETDISFSLNSSELLHIMRVIGVFNGLLLIVIGYPNQTFGMAQLVALDVLTGKIKWHIHKSEDPITGYHLPSYIRIPGLYSLTANEDGTKLYGLEYSSFIEIDTATGKVLRLQNLGGKNAHTIHYQDYELGIKNISYYQGHLYFTAYLQGYSLFSCLLGAFDLITEEIVWLHDMKFRRQEQFFGASDFPILDGNRLYISAYDTVFIFEKEDTYTKTITQ